MKTENKFWNDPETLKAYRSFYVYKFGELGVDRMLKRKTSAMKIKDLRMQYLKFFQTDPEQDFLDEKEKYIGLNPMKMRSELAEKNRKSPK